MLVWGLLAGSWVRLVDRVVPGKFSPLWSAAIFLAIQATGNLSGEWLIGGVEAKGFAYAFLFFAIAAACDRSWTESGIELGVVISFHPVIGLWGTAALATAIVVGQSSEVVHVSLLQPDGLRSSPGLARAFRGLMRPAIFCVIFSLPGLVPAVAMLLDRPSADKAHIADVDQVFHRLKHHLDPAEFSKAAWLSYAGLVGRLAGGAPRGGPECGRAPFRLVRPGDRRYCRGRSHRGLLAAFSGADEVLSLPTGGSFFADRRGDCRGESVGRCDSSNGVPTRNVGAGRRTRFGSGRPGVVRSCTGANGQPQPLAGGDVGRLHRRVPLD